LEKSGMERRYGYRGGLLMRTLLTGFFRTSSLTLIGLVAAGFPCRSIAETGPEEPLVLLVSVSPERPKAEADFIVSILVDHPDPAETTVRPPALPATLVLERTRIEPHLIRGTQDRDERWTEIEFTFTLRSDEDFVLGPFEVSVPGKRAATAPLKVRVAGSDGGPEAPGRQFSLEWRGVPSSLISGESTEVLLVLVGGGAPRNGEPAVQAPVVQAPENAVMEALPLRSEDRDRGVIGRFALTALQPPGFILPAVALSTGGALTIRAGAVRVSVSPASRQGATDSVEAPPPSSSPTASSKAAKEKAAKPPFPKVPKLPAPLAVPFRASTERIFSLASAAWSRGDYAAALAVLRKAERDSLAGFIVSGVRREAEREIGIENAPNEAYAPTFALSALAAAAVLLSVLVFFSARRVTSGHYRGYKVAILFLALACFSLAYLLLVRLDAAGLLGRGVAAVAPDCIVYRIPETDGGVSTEFQAGQTVRLRSSAGSWIYAEASDGRSGWVAGDRVIRY
jgi:hypothetical protein